MAYCFPRGASLLLAWIVLSGDITGVTSVSAALRPALPANPALVDPAQSPAASFVTSFVAAAEDGSSPAFYKITLAASSSATLPIGNYLADLRINYSDGSVQYASAVMISITEPATTA